MSRHLVNYVKNSELENDSTLHVIGVITNPVRYQSRYRLYHQWEKEMLATQNVALYTVEAAYGDRAHEVTVPDNPRHLQLRTKSEIWLKENLINLGIRNLLPKDWKYVAWVDCDVSFRDPGWALSSIHQLQHYPIIQPWTDVVDLDFYGGIFQHSKSFGSLHAKNLPKAHYRNNPYKHPYGHSGFAWACTRFFYENVGKLLDFCIVGRIQKGMHGLARQSLLGVRLECWIHAWSHRAPFSRAERAAAVLGPMGYIAPTRFQPRDRSSLRIKRITPA